MDNFEARKKALELSVQAYCAEMVLEATALAHHKKSYGLEGDYSGIIEKAKQFEKYLRRETDSDGVSYPLKD